MKRSSGGSVEAVNRRLRLLIKRLPRSTTPAFMVALAFGVIGTLLLINSKAATPVASTEAESGTINSAATNVADGSASGAHAVKFGSGTGSSGTTCTIGQVPGAGNCVAAPTAAASGKEWKVTFNDDFNGSSLDTSKWTPCFDWNFGDCTSSFNQGYEHYLASQDQVSGGLAHLVAEPLSPAYSSTACYNNSCTYKSGLISTSRKSGNNPATAYLYKFTYGYVEASLKVPSTQGFFIAWWMLPADTTFNYEYDAAGNANPNGPFRYEIDILEELGSDPTDMEMHYSWANDSSAYYSPNDTAHNGTCANLDYSKAQHRFGVDWEPTFVAFYIDGVKCGQHNATANAPVPNVPMQLIMDQMVSNNWMRSIGKPLLNNTLTNDVQVDYVHVYQQQ